MSASPLVARSLVEKLPIFRCYEVVEDKKVYDTLRIASDVGMLAVAPVSVFALGLFPKLTAMLVNAPYVGALAANFTTLPFTSKMVVLGLLSTPGFVLGLGGSFVVTAAIAAVKAKTVFVFFNAACLFVLGAVSMSKWNAKAFQLGVFHDARETFNKLTEHFPRRKVAVASF